MHNSEGFYSPLLTAIISLSCSDGTVYQMILPVEENEEGWDQLEWSVLFHTPSITGFNVGDAHFILFEGLKSSLMATKRSTKI
jgi:hypothetical protein